MGLHDYTFYDLINRNAISFCDRPAWFEVDDERTPTFSEIKEQVDRLAGGLVEIGLRKDDVLMVQLPNVVELVMVYLAAARIGAVVSPLPVQYRKHELRQVVGLTTAASILFAAAVGVCAALSQLVLAGGVTALVLITLRGVGYVEQWLEQRRR